MYQKLADLDPSNLTIRVKLAETLHKEGLDEEAVSEFLKAASGCLQMGQLPEAQKFYERALQVQPASLEGHLSLGLLNYRQNDFTGAIAHLDRVLQGGQADPANMMILAESYKNVDQFQKAEEVLAQIIDQDPGNEEARISLGRLDLRMGKIEEGYLLLDKIAEDHLRDNEVRASLELLNEVRMAAPGFIEVYRRLADLYGKIGDEAEARKAQEQIAEIFFQRSEWKEAKDAYQGILEADSSNEEARGRLEEIERLARGEKDEPTQRMEAPLIPPAPVLPIEVPEVEILEFEAPETQLPEVEILEVKAAESQFSEVEAPQVDTEPSAETPERGLDFSKIELELGEKMGPTELAFADQPLADSGDRPAAGKEMEEMEEEEHLDEEINEWLVEADVYLKYGIVDKAMDHLKRIIQIAPRNIGAHERLKMIYMDKGHREAAILQCLTLADIFEKRGEKQNAIGEIEAILSLSPGHSIGKKKLEELVSQLPASLTEEALLSSLEPIQFVDEEIEVPVEATTPLETAFPSGEPGNLRVEDRRSRVESIEEEELPEGFESLLGRGGGHRRGQKADFRGSRIRIDGQIDDGP